MLRDVSGVILKIGRRCYSQDLLVGLDPEILVDAPLPDRVVVLEVNVDYLEAKERVNENGKGAITNCETGESESFGDESANAAWSGGKLDGGEQSREP